MGNRTFEAKAHSGITVDEMTVGKDRINLASGTPVEEAQRLGALAKMLKSEFPKGLDVVSINTAGRAGEKLHIVARRDGGQSVEFTAGREILPGRGPEFDRLCEDIKGKLFNTGQ